jgi:hypothetical protein
MDYMYVGLMIMFALFGVSALIFAIGTLDDKFKE